MNNQVHVTFKNFKKSEQVGDYIDQRYNRIRKLSHKIVRCNAVISVPHRSHRFGNDFHVSVLLGIPGKDLVAHSHSKHSDGSDLYAAISEAFESLVSQLKANQKKHTRKHAVERRHFRSDIFVRAS